MDTRKTESYLFAFGLLVFLAGVGLWLWPPACPPGWGPCYNPHLNEAVITMAAGGGLILVGLFLRMARMERWSVPRPRDGVRAKTK